MTAVGVVCLPKQRYNRAGASGVLGYDLDHNLRADYAGKITDAGFIVEPLPTEESTGLAASSWNPSTSTMESTPLADQVVYNVYVRNRETGTYETIAYPVDELDFEVDVPATTTALYDGDAPSADLAALIEAKRASAL